MDCTCVNPFYPLAPQDKKTLEEDKRVFMLVRIIAPDLGEVDDDVVLTNINICRPLVSKSRFGKLYEQALAYLTAHRVKLYDATQKYGSDSSQAVGGSITSEHEGDLSRSYGSLGGGGGSKYPDLLDKTVYGIEFKRLRETCVIGVVTRLG